MLVYDEGNFFQWLEGPVLSVDKLWRSIQNDPRHRDVRVLGKHSIPVRLFGDWEMRLAYRTPQGDEEGEHTATIEHETGTPNILAGFSNTVSAPPDLVERLYTPDTLFPEVWVGLARLRSHLLPGEQDVSIPALETLDLVSELAVRSMQSDPEMAVSWYQIGELQETLGEYDKAVALYKRALGILEKRRGLEHPVLASILDKLAALCMELEMEKEAVPLYERLLVIREKALRPTHPQLVMSLNNLAESYRLQGRYAEAEECYQKSLTINEAVHGKEHPSVAAVLQELAKLCNSQRKPEEATQYQRRAAAIFQKSVEASEQKSGGESLTLEL